jgi:hypothetical protein
MNSEDLFLKCFKSGRKQPFLTWRLPGLEGKYKLDKFTVRNTLDANPIAVLIRRVEMMIIALLGWGSWF